MNGKFFGDDIGFDRASCTYRSFAREKKFE